MKVKSSEWKQTDKNLRAGKLHTNNHSFDGCQQNESINNNNTNNDMLREFYEPVKGLKAV